MKSNLIAEVIPQECLTLNNICYSKGKSYALFACNCLLLITNKRFLSPLVRRQNFHNKFQNIQIEKNFFSASLPYNEIEDIHLAGINFKISI